MKTFLLSAFAVVVLASCKKDNECETVVPSNIAPANETTALQNYLNANSITNASNKQGMFFEIVTQGAGESPNLCSSINVDYTGNLINGNSTGSQFDAATATTLNLSSLIKGWQIVLPMVKAGGTVNLYVPPTFGYGAQAQTNSAGAVVIPANAYLKFTIKINTVSN